MLYIKWIEQNDTLEKERNTPLLSAPEQGKGKMQAIITGYKSMQTFAAILF